MTIARRLKEHLDASGVAYETVPHPRAATASETAQAAHVPGDRLAKAVVIHMEDGCALAVAPSTHRIDLGALQQLLDRRLGLAGEPEIARIFDDCDAGAAPPVGAAYGLPAALDESLTGLDAVWFEGGDHRTLVKVSGADFDRLTADARRARFSEHV